MTKRVLVAEDEPNIVESLSFLLKRAGFSVDVEMDGKRALQSAMENPPSVLVLDVMLPNLDGYEILRRLRSDDRGVDIPIVMLTAKGQREDRETAMDSGADMFITKPFSNAEIVAAVDTLSRGRPSKENSQTLSQG